MKIIDCVTFNGEYDLFELRYNILKDYVDEFRVVEFDKTFSGKEKPNYILESRNVFYDPIHTWEKVKCFHIEESVYSKYKELAENSPNTQGADHWKREFMQKESIKDCLTDLADDDIVFIGDCDEIWEEKAIELAHYGVWKLKLLVYCYYLNQRSNEEFWGTIVGQWKDIKDEVLNHLRVNARKTDTEYGWHFTSMANNLRKKLTDSYTDETYANEWVLKHLEENIKESKDFLGRAFQYSIQEWRWPQYLKDHRNKYKDLIK